MKRGILIGAGLVAAAAAAWYGPHYWAGYQFLNVVDQQTKEYEANGGPWPQLQDTCILCHGDNGQPGNSRYASLAGLPAAYIENQLNAFAQGHRNSPPMESISRRLKEEEIKMLAAHYERQTPTRTESVTPDAAMMEKGQVIANEKGCTSCHGDQLQGSPIAPRLAGQSELYLVDQLTAFKLGNRKDPTQAMNGMASLLSDDDIKAAAHYLANTQPTGLDGN